MTVWLVWLYAYTIDDQLIGIFTTQAQAQAYADAMPDFRLLKRYVVEEIELPYSTGVAHIIEHLAKE